MAARYLVPALAVAGRAIAQCSVTGTTTIQNQGDATGLASCTTFSGSIAIATDTAGAIALDGIEEITGDIVAKNVSGLTSISGDSLTTIDGGFLLDTIQALTEINFPLLTSVKTITWNALANLQGLNLAAEIQMAQSLSISNTRLVTLTGINLQMIDTLTLVNNNFLNDISMQLGNISDSLTLNANGPNVSANFPNLIWANTMTFQNVSSINLASLQSMNSSLTFQSNFVKSISAPNLTVVGSGLTFRDNANLTTISMPVLTTIDGPLEVANNSDLTTVKDFGKLATINGAFEFYGVFTDVELPGLKDIEGLFTLVSTDTSGSIDKSCTVFKGEVGRTATIKVLNACNGGDSGALTSNGTTTTSSSPAASSSTGAANAIVITGATGLLGVVAAIFGML